MILAVIAPVVVASAYIGLATAYAANPKIYAKTASRAKVMLAGTPIIGATVDSSDFIASSIMIAVLSVVIILTLLSIPASGVSYDSVYVAAKTLAGNVTESSN